MGQAQQAKPPAERQTIMTEHRRTMPPQMTAVKAATGPTGSTGEQPGSALGDESGLQMHATMQMMMQAMQRMMQQQSASNPAP